MHGFRFSNRCRRLRCGLAAALLALTAGSAPAHHGLDFLLVQDAFVPVPGAGVVYGGFDWTEINGQDTFGSEPGFILGLLPGLAFGAGAEVADAGDGWQVYGLGPYLQMQLLPKAWTKRVRLAARVGYQISTNPFVFTTLEPVTRIETIREVQTVSIAVPAPKRRRPSGTGSGGGGNPGGGGGGGGGPDGGPDAAPVARGGRHGGHGHGGGGGGTVSGGGTTVTTRTVENLTTREVTTYEEVEREFRVEGWNARLMLEVDVTQADRVVGNLVHFNGRGSGAQWGYAAGWRHAFHHDLAVSVEALGNFNRENWHQAVTAVHYAPVHWGLIKLGAAFGLTAETPDLSLITGFLVRF